VKPTSIDRSIPLAGEGLGKKVRKKLRLGRRTTRSKERDNAGGGDVNRTRNLDATGIEKQPTY
jgi:uncharacterized membrane protein